MQNLKKGVDDMACSQCEENMLQLMQLIDLILQISYQTILIEIKGKYVIGFGKPTKR